MRRDSGLAVDAAAASGSGRAITFGEHDRPPPWVGLVVLFDAPVRRSSAAAARCSRRRGSSRRATAGAGRRRRAAGAALARIWFAEGPIDATPPTTAARATPAALHRLSVHEPGRDGERPCRPGWNGELTVPQTSDVGVVAITSASALPTSYGTLAPIGTVDALRKKARTDAT